MPNDVNKAADYATQNFDQAHTYGAGHCARYVENALTYGGEFPPVHIGGLGQAKDLGPALTRLGFQALPAKALPRKGDVVVIGGTSRNPAGHAAIFNGTNWVSDFVQNQLYPGPSYREEKPAYVIYRYGAPGS